MSAKDHLERPSERAQNSATYNVVVLQLYKEMPRGGSNSGATTPDHIDFACAGDPYTHGGKQPSFNVDQQKGIYQDIRSNHTDLHNFIKTEQKALDGSSVHHGKNHGVRDSHAVDSHHDHDHGTHTVNNSHGRDRHHVAQHHVDQQHHDAHSHKTVAQRMITLQSSIFAHTKSGELSESEFVQLERNQHQIEGMKKSLGKDGTFSAADRKQLTDAINTEWGTIKEFKCNSDGVTAPGHYGNNGTDTPPVVTQPGGSDNVPPGTKPGGSDSVPPGTKPDGSDGLPPGTKHDGSDGLPPATNPGDSTNLPSEPVTNPDDSGSPSAVMHLINPHTKFTVSAIAKGALNDTPNPISVVQVEGKLASEPVAAASIQSLKDMPRMEALGEAYQATKDEKYASKAKEYLVAWAKVNHSTGDPINDAQITNTINTYALIKDSDAVKNDPAAKNKIESYLRSTANTELKSTWFNMDQNWNAHRIEIIGNVGFALNDKSLVSQSMDLYKNFLDRNITADGSTLDFHTRDAFHYQHYDLYPLLRLAEVAGRNGYPGMFDHKGADGGSLRKAIDFEIPYITGAKTHLEFKNSTIAFDKKRADAGVSGFGVKNFDPKTAKYLMELASELDPSYNQYDKYLT